MTDEIPVCLDCGSSCIPHCRPAEGRTPCDLVQCVNQRCNSYGTPDGRRWRSENGRGRSVL